MAVVLLPGVEGLSDKPQITKKKIRDQRADWTRFSHRLLPSLSSSRLPGMLGNTNPALLRAGMICTWSEGVDVGGGRLLTKSFGWISL